MTNKNNKEFIPNNNQLSYLEFILDLDNKNSKKEIAKLIGITEFAIYKWYRDKRFVDWINTYRTRLIDKSLLEIYKTASRKARAGDFNYSRLLLEMSGNYTPRSEAKVTSIDKKDKLDNLSDREIEAEFSKELKKFRSTIKKES